MILRYRIGFTEKIIDVDYAEIEDFFSCEAKQGIWRFKNGSDNKRTD